MWGMSLPLLQRRRASGTRVLIIFAKFRHGERFRSARILGDTAPETSGFSASGGNGRVFFCAFCRMLLLFGVVWVLLFRVTSSFTTPLLRIIRYGSHKRADDAQKWRRWCWGGVEKRHPNDAEKSHRWAVSESAWAVSDDAQKWRRK